MITPFTFSLLLVVWFLGKEWACAAHWQREWMTVDLPFISGADTVSAHLFSMLVCLDAHLTSPRDEWLNEGGLVVIFFFPCHLLPVNNCHLFTKLWKITKRGTSFTVWGEMFTKCGSAVNKPLMFWILYLGSQFKIYQTQNSSRLGI